MQGADAVRGVCVGDHTIFCVVRLFVWVALARLLAAHSQRPESSGQSRTQLLLLFDRPTKCFLENRCHCRNHAHPP